jgi:hypothetical protein
MPQSFKKLSHTLFFFLLMLITCIQLFSQVRSPKRGLAYGHLTEKDLQVLEPGVSWWYNWYHQPENTVSNVYQNYGFEFVPMAWNGGYNKTGLMNFLSAHPDVKYILGWNEPNFLSQANMTPSQAAAGWKDLEAIADSFHLKIVGPAVNYCDVCVDSITDPVAYLDSFFIKCPDCRVDYIAVHNYMGNVSALQWYIGLFKKYGKPIWLTEFANWENNPTVQQQKSYLIGAVDYLESDTSVFRYAWFTGRYSGAPYIALLASTSGVLTDLGKTYINMPVHDTSFYYTVPARIEVEAYSTMKGILLEATSDTSGTANVGYIDVNDWLEYNIDVPYDSAFRFDIRYAGTSTGSLDVLVDGIKIGNFSLASTGGWQNWKSISSTLPLKAGKQKLRLLAKKSGFNLNWIRLYHLEPTSVPSSTDHSWRIYPNPANSAVTIDGLSGNDHCELFDVLGHRIPVQINADKLDLSALQDGIYFIKITRQDKSSSCLRIQKIQQP